MSAIEPRIAIVPIYQGDYLDRIRHLEKRYDAALAAEKDAPRVLTDASLAGELAEEHESLVAGAEASALQVTIKALGRKQWRELVAKHPAREGHEGDAIVGVNEDTFKDALVAASTDDLDDDDLDSISDIDFDRLYFTAFALNRSPVAGPKALPPVSQTSQGSDGT